MHQRRQTLVLLLGLLGGCASTATVSLRDRTTLEARITGGDARHLLFTSEYGVDTVVRRADVRDIDHPGNVVATVGGILAGAGVMNLVTFLSACSGSTLGSGCLPFVATSGGMVAGGAGMLLWGLWTWLASKTMVTDTLSGQALPTPAPEPVPAAPPPGLLPTQPL